MYKPDDTELGALLRDWAELHRPASPEEAGLGSLLAAVLSGTVDVSAAAPLDRLLESRRRLRRTDEI
jgi:hypothetical protein